MRTYDITRIDLCHVSNITEAAYSSGNWRTLPIQECGEPLVKVSSRFCHPFYALEMRLTSDKRIYLRQSVLEMFLKANSIVNQFGLSLVVYDGWRSVELQERLFWHYLKLFTAAKFGLVKHFAQAVTSSEVRDAFLKLPRKLREKIQSANRTYVSWPSANPSHPSPHATGGSIDVWLFSEGQQVDLGVPFDWMEEDAGAFYHLKTGRRRVFANDADVCKNRELLLSTMISVGFSCYPAEIWHFNYGNQMDALVTGRTACYSYIEP